MNEIPVPAPVPAERKIPLTAADALALWDAGEPVPAFEVESERASQQDIYFFAFERIRSHLNQPGGWTVGDPFPLSRPLTGREMEAAESVALVSIKKGWAAMLRQHRHESIAQIQVRKPAPADPALEKEA